MKHITYQLDWSVLKEFYQVFPFPSPISSSAHRLAAGTVQKNLIIRKERLSESLVSI